MKYLPDSIYYFFAVQNKDNGNIYASHNTDKYKTIKDTKQAAINYMVKELETCLNQLKKYQKSNFKLFIEKIIKFF